MLSLPNCASAQSESDPSQSDSIVIWSEDFTGYVGNAFPQNGKNAVYSTKKKYSGALPSVQYTPTPLSVSPGLYLTDNSKKGTPFIVDVKLYGASGKFTLSLKSDEYNNLTVTSSSKTAQVSMGDKPGVYIVDVPKGLDVLNLNFSSNDNLTIDDIVLKAPADCRGSLPSPNISYSQSSATTSFGDAFEAPTLNNPDNLPIQYWTSDQTVASVEDNGKVSIHSIGNATITATFVGNDNLAYKDVSYFIHVNRRVPEDELFYESFDQLLSQGGPDDLSSTSSYCSGFAETGFDSPYSGGKPQMAYKCIAFDQIGQLYTIAPIADFKGGDVLLTFKTAAFKKSGSTGSVSLVVDGKAVSKKLFPVNSRDWEVVSYLFTDFNPATTFSFTGSDIYIDSVSILSIPKTIPLTIGNTGFSTMYYSNYALKVPEGVDAYTMKVEDDVINSSHRYTSGEVVPKATGFIVRAEPGTYNFDVSYEDGVVDEGNQLRGSDFKQLTSGGDVYYMLAYNDAGKVGFYWAADNGGAFLSGAHKAYLALPSSLSSSAKDGFILNFDDAVTGINALSKPTTGDGNQYNALGQRVDKSYKGIIIKNGRKFIQR